MTSSFKNFLLEGAGQEVFAYMYLGEHEDLDYDAALDSLRLFATEVGCVKAMIADLKRYHEDDYYSLRDEHDGDGPNPIRDPEKIGVDGFLGAIDGNDFSPSFQAKKMKLK